MDAPAWLAGILIFLAVAAVLVGIPVLFWYVSTRLERRRTAALQSAVASMPGWRFSPGEEPGLLQLLSASAMLSPRTSRGHALRNVIRGCAADGTELTLFDYRFVAGGGRSSQSWDQTIVQLTGTGLRLPEFSLKPEQFIHKLASTFGYQDIDFVDHLDFSRRYLLRGPDEPAIRGAFAPQVLSFFQSQDKLCAESLPGGRLLVFRLDRRVKPDPAALRELVETALSVVAAFRGHPTREDARPTVEP